MGYNDFTPPVGSTPNYMTDWSTSPTKHAAMKIEHTADKAAFAVDILNSAVTGFDAIEKELIEMSNSPHPPQPHHVRTIAHRIDTHQKQVQDGLEHIKRFMHEIERTSDHLGKPRTTWGSY
ncbi:hypothetical protein ACFX4N_24030 [Priestia sp. YIM B13551]|uniref:hypothetical protein n=1 Tax=Priestia sp. YIM B13551 TaxID=3366306 RepID=UPI00366B6754